MRGNWIEATHNGTGGSSTLTLADVTGSPNYDDVFGASGTILVDYIINEYTTSDRNVLTQSEQGIGSLVLSTGVFTRVKVETTWTGSTYDAINPARLTIGSTAANVRIMCGPAVNSAPQCPPFVSRALGDDVGIPAANHMGSSATIALAADTAYYWPYLWAGRGDIDQASIRVSTVSIGAAQAKWAVFQFDSDALPGKRLYSFQNAGVDTFDLRMGGVSGWSTRSVSMHLDPGWYWMGIILEAAANVVIGDTSEVLMSPAGISGTGSINRVQKAITYATGLSDPADATSLVTPITSPPLLCFRPRNTT